jgi:hypothetical protein
MDKKHTTAPRRLKKILQNYSNRLVVAAFVLIFGAGGAYFITATHASTPTTFYVSLNGNNSDGTSWTSAWSNTSNINWNVVQSGDTIVLDGGTSKCSVSPYDFQVSSPNPGVNCGMSYAAFTIGQSNVTITRSSSTGHDGTVVIDGGRNTPLPYCNQTTYSAPTGVDYGVDLNGHSGIVIDGLVRSGIIVRGAQYGVRMSSGSNNTLRNLELFDNGFTDKLSNGNYWTDGAGITMSGQDNTYDRLLIHDNGQDEFHSDSAGYSEAGSQITNTWMGSIRDNPAYPGEPFNDLQVSGHDPGCTHADSVQIFEPNITMSGLNFDHDIFGPGENQGLYPSDGDGATFDNVTVTNSLFLDVASHNIITDNAVNGWAFDHDTIFATQGGSEVPSNGSNSLTNSIKYGGDANPVGWTSVSNSIWYGGASIPGATNTDPDFVGPIPTGTLPPLSELFTVDLTPQCGSCAGLGSPLTSYSSLLTRIDQLDAGSSTPAPSTPNNVQAAANSSTSVTVSWNASTDSGGPGLGGYYILRNGSQVGSVNASTTSYTNTGLTAGTHYSYTVEAYDTDSPPNVSAASAAASVTTAAGPVPVVNITSVANNALVHGSSLALDATASPSGGNSIAKAQLLVGSTVVQTLTAAPFNFTLNTLNYKDGSYTVKVKATDNQGNVGTSSIAVTITNGDVNSDNKVGLPDLAIMAAHWNQQSGATYSGGDLNGDGKVTVADLGVLANNWGKTW